MLYLVSGASRSGKTMIANKILKRHNIPFMSLDWLVMGFSNGMPQSGIHHMLYPDEIAEKIWRFLQFMCESMLWSDIDYVIEGEAILPELIRDLVDKYPQQIKICFVGYTDIDVDQKVVEMRAHCDTQVDWLMSKSDAYITDHVENMLRHSKKIKNECIQFDLPYFDTSSCFIDSIEQATEYLLN